MRSAPALFPAPDDYLSVDTTLIFQRGAESGVILSGSQQCITIVIMEDDLSEGDEVLQVMAISSDPNANTPLPVTVTILDNDGEIQS